MVGYMLGVLLNVMLIVNNQLQNRGRPSNKPEVIIKKFTREYDDSIWHYDLDKTDKGPYLVEMTDPTYDKLEKLYDKLERLNKPKYHENGRKKRTTKADRYIF